MVVSAPAVLVAGAGPVGLTLACELARRDVPVRVVDRLPAPSGESRALVVHARTLEALERIGAVDAVIAAGVRTTAWQAHVGGSVIAELALDTVDSPFPFSVSLPQAETERILRERLAALGVAVERGVEVTGVGQDADGVRATLAHADGRRETLSCGWIAGADGSRSAVRHACGDRLEGSFAGERFALGDVEVDSEPGLDRSVMHTFFTPDGPLLVFPMRGSRMRIMAQLEHGSEDRAAAPTLDGLQRLTDDRAQGMPLRLRAAHWLTTFEIHHAQVSSYRHGRAFLLGDAAHVHSPAGGQGMNTGIQDAFNLGWKLAAAWRGTAGDALLDSYDAERRPVARRVIEMTTRVTHVGTLRAPWARALRDHAVRVGAGLAPVQHALARAMEETDVAYRSSPVVAGHGPHDGPRPGDAAPDVAAVPLREALLAAPADAHVALHVAGHRVAAPLATRALPLWQVRAGGDGPAGGFDAVVADPERRVAAHYGVNGRGALLLVRPDGYLGLVAEPGDAAAVERYAAALR